MNETNKEHKSDCCGAEVKTICSDEGTCHWECEKCGKSCNDIFYGFESRNETNKEWEIELKEELENERLLIFDKASGSRFIDYEVLVYFISKKLSQKDTEWREKAQEMRWWEECDGCEGGHNSFWKTIVESDEWKEWKKEQAKRFHTEEKEGCFDIDECTECGWISKEHWKEFIKFIINSNKT